MRRIWRIALLTVVAMLIASCGGDGGDDDAAVDTDRGTVEDGGGSSSTAPADDQSGGDDASGGDDQAGDDDGSGGDGDEPEDDTGSECPSETLLSATTETTYEGDEEILPGDTEFPSGSFVMDLDGSGYGPELSGVLSTDADEDTEALTHTNPDQPDGDVRRVLIRLTGPAEGETEFPLGVYDVTFADGVVDATEGMGLDQLDVQNGESNRQASHFTELELTHVGDGRICGELRSVDRSDQTSQAPTYVEGRFVADYSEIP